MTLETPVAQLPTVRGRAAAGMARLGIRTVRNLLFHFPARHEDRRAITPIADAVPDVPVVVRGTLLSISSEEGFRRRGGRIRRMALTHAVVRDESGELPIVWFHQQYLAQQYAPGTSVYLAGTPARGDHGVSLVAPEIERAVEGRTPIHVGRLVPIYPETAGVTSRQLRFLIARVLPLATELTEYLPEETRGVEGLVGIAEAIRAIHFPDTPETLEAARRRLSFDELFV